MELNFKGYRFIYDNINKQYDKFIGNYTELVKIITHVYNVDSGKIKMYYQDCDGEFNISSQNDYNQVLGYHTQKNEDNITILIKRDINVSNILNSANMTESRINLDSQKMKMDAINKYKKSIIDETLTKELSNMKLEIENLKNMINTNKDDMKGMLHEVMGGYFKGLEDTMKKSLSRNSTYTPYSNYNSQLGYSWNNKEEDRGDYKYDVKNCEICTGNKLEILTANTENCNTNNDESNIDYGNSNNDYNINGNVEDYCLIELNKSSKICGICNSVDVIPKFICYICEDLYICHNCEIKHCNHPLLTISKVPYFQKERLYLYSLTKKKAKDDDIKVIKAILANKSSIQMQIISHKNNDFVMKFNEKIIFPIEIFNLSSTIIYGGELLITAVNNNVFKVDNKTIETAIKKKGSVLVNLELISPFKIGIYEFEIIIMHVSRKIEFDPLKLRIKVVTETLDDLELFYKDFPSLKASLSRDQKIQLMNCITEKLTNLTLYEINLILERNKYDLDLSFLEIMNIK